MSSSFLKVVSPDGFDHKQPVAEVVPISSKGLVGGDLQRWTKQAGDMFVHRVKQANLKPGEELVRLLALGDGPTMGANRNGDRFPVEECRNNHDSFVKLARWFRDHDHKPTSTRYGRVVDSFYNEPMGRVELLTALYATKQAADRDKSGPSKVADRELNKLNRGEDLGVSMACFVSPNTPVRVKDRGYVPISQVKVGDYVWTHRGRWRPVTELKRRPYTGDLVRFSSEGGGRTVTMTADHPWYVKPGNVDAELTHDSGYFEAGQKTQSLLWTPANEITLDDRLVSSSCHLKVNDSQLEDFEKHAERIGRQCVVPYGVNLNAAALQPPDVVFASAEPCKLAFLGAWYDYQNLPAAWELPDRPSFYAASLPVALSLRDLIHQLGLCVDLTPVESGILVSPRRTLAGFEAFTKLGRHLRSDDLPDDQGGVAPNSLLEMPLTSVELSTTKTEKMTYNFEVEEDHSYLAMGMVSHNCAIDYDVCNGCGNRAKTAADYCGPSDCHPYGGCQDNLARTFDDGHTLAVDNYGCKWFDISDVVRPADRIAYGARVKTASDLAKLPGYQQAQIWGVESMPSIDDTTIKLASLLELVEESRNPNPASMPVRENVLKSIGGMTQGYKTRLKTAAAQGVMLNPVEFAHLTGRPELSEDIRKNAYRIHRLNDPATKLASVSSWSDSPSNSFNSQMNLRSEGLFSPATAVKSACDPSADKLWGGGDATIPVEDEPVSFQLVKLAADYAGYQLAVLPTVAENTFYGLDLTLARLLHQTAL